MQGRAKLSEIENYEKRWHTGKSRLELFEYLGFTEEEYHRFVKNPLALPRIMKAAQDRIGKSKRSARAGQTPTGIATFSQSRLVRLAGSKLSRNAIAARGRDMGKTVRKVAIRTARGSRRCVAAAGD